MSSIFSDLMPNSRRKCKVKRLLDSLSAADSEILTSAIEGGNFGMKHLAQELTKRGKPISETPLYHHRKRACSCYTGLSENA